MDLPISSITLLPELQIRPILAPERVARYADQAIGGSMFPPVKIFFDGSRYLLSSGWLRLKAAVKIGLTTIPADVQSGDQKQALWYALADNANTMTLGERRHACGLAVQVWPE